MARSAVQRARGTTAQHSTFTGLNGETTIDTTKKTVVVHDGVRQGGYPLALESEVNVKSFGAKLDGVTDDSAALAAALAAGLTVVIPEGDLYIGSANIVISRTGTRLRGTGQKSRIVAAAAPASGAVQIVGTSSPAYRAYAVIENLSIVGGGTVGLKLLNVANVDVRNVYVGTGFTRGIDLEGALLCNFFNVSSEANTYGLKAYTSATAMPCNLNQFYSCHFNSNTQTAIRWDEGGANVFHGCGFEGNGVTGQSSGALEFLSMCGVGVQPGAIFKSCWFETNHSANAEFYYGGGGGVVLLANSWYSTDVKYNVQIANAVVSMMGNGLNPVLTVGAFGTTSFNAYLDVGSTGVCWNNVAVQVKFDSSSKCCFQDTSGRMLGVFDVSLTGKTRYWIDNANHADIGINGTALDFNNPAGNFIFEQQVRLNGTANGGANVGALTIPSGGMFVGRDIACFGKFLKDGASINVTGSRGGNTALASLLSALASTGLITDSTTA